MPRLRQRYAAGPASMPAYDHLWPLPESELAQSLNPLTLPPGVVMGYRSSMPIIELS